MGFSDEKQAADQWAQKAMELMENHDIPAAPPNYEIWYSYVSERFPDLKVTLDQMIADKQPFEGHKNIELYEKFLGNTKESAAIHKAGTQMQDQLVTVMNALGGASEEISGHNIAIKDGIANFNSNPGAGGLEAFIQTMIAETREIQKTNADLQAKLDKSSGEIKSLQQNLIQAERETYSDGLTGIANRKKFDSALQHEMSEAEASGEPLCLVVCDIDFFKKFNDSYGHQVGDQVLKLVARSLHDNVKGGDLAARYGGEEFALILPKTKLQDAYALVEKIRIALASRTIRNRQKGLDYGTVTMSLGVSLYRSGETAMDLIGRADEALYAAKSAGRNQTMLEEGN